MKNHKGKRTTLKDVADALGVSVATVSRALNPESRHNVTLKLTEKIRKTSAELGYRRNVAAYSLKTNRTRAVGVVVPDITDPAFSHLIRGIERALERHRYIAILANTDDDAAREAAIIDALNDRGVDGYILASVKRKGRGAANGSRAVPVVTVTRSTDDPAIPSVRHDQEEGIRRIVTHLVSLGHRKIAFIGGPQDISTGYDRYRAFSRQADALSIERSRKSVCFAASFSEAEGERCAEELLAGGISFTALVCANDRLAIGALVTLQRRGLDCPADVSVTGINDMPLANRMNPPLTTVRLRHFEAGIAAAELMVDILEKGEASSRPRHVVLPVELIVRGSTAPPPTAPAAPRRRRNRPIGPK